MSSKISDEKRQLIKELYEKNVSIPKIAIEVEVSYYTVYCYTKAKEKGFESPTKYHEHKIKERGFKSLTQYYRHITGVRGFESQTDYLRYLVGKKGLTFGGYETLLAIKRGYKTQTDYLKHLAEEKGYTLSERQRDLAEKRQQLPLNKKLGKVIIQGLENIGERQKWLARELDISEGAISRYISGGTTPRKRLQKKLFETLKLPYKTLDDLLE